MKDEKRFHPKPTEIEGKIEVLKEGFRKNLSDEELVKKTNSSINWVLAVRKTFGLARTISGINIFEASKKTAYNEYSEKVGVTFWVPHKEAEKLGLKKTQYQFMGRILGPKKMELVFDDVVD